MNPNCKYAVLSGSQALNPWVIFALEPNRIIKICALAILCAFVGVAQRESSAAVAIGRSYERGPTSAFRSLLPAHPSQAAPNPSASREGRQTAPEPQVFAIGIISTGHEFALTFTRDMKEAYFTRNFPDKKINHIMRTEFKNGAWQPATPISFSGDQWSDLDPSLSPNGRRLFFISTRPGPGAPDARTRNMDIWYADRVGKNWGTPQHLENVNSPGKEGSPTVAKDGALCFFSDRGRAANANSIYCSELRGKKYSEPKKLGTEINFETSDTSPFLSPDGNTLLFYSERPGGYGKADLYYSFKRDGHWLPAMNLGPIVNTPEFEYNPVVSPDGNTLYFGRSGSIYWVPIGLLRISGLDAKHLRQR